MKNFLSSVSLTLTEATVNMHRQSLGSPAAKLHSHGALVVSAGNGVIRDDIKNNFISQDLQNHRKDILASSSAAEVDDDEYKSQTSHQQNSKVSSSSSRLIHLIPLLTFFCFLILYLSSHDPSRKELAQFSRLTTLSSKKVAIDSSDTDDFGQRFLEIEKSDVLALQSLRNLQEEINKRRRLHRKFGH